MGYLGFWMIKILKTSFWLNSEEMSQEGYRNVIPFQFEQKKNEEFD